MAFSLTTTKRCLKCWPMLTVWNLMPIDRLSGIILYSRACTDWKVSSKENTTHNHCQVIWGFLNFCPNLKKALAINRVKMVTTLTVSSFFFVLFEFKYFFLMQHVFSGWKPLQETNIKYSTHKLPSIKYTNNNSACKLLQNSNTKAHFCNRLPLNRSTDNIKTLSYQ